MVSALPKAFYGHGERSDARCPGRARRRSAAASKHGRPAPGSGGGWPSIAQPSPRCAAAPGVPAAPRNHRARPPGAQRLRKQRAGSGSPSGSPWSRSGFRTVPPGCARSPSWLHPARPAVRPPPRRPARLCAAPSHGRCFMGPRPPAARPAAAPARHRPRRGARRRPLCDTGPRVVPDGRGGPCGVLLGNHRQLPSVVCGSPQTQFSKRGCGIFTSGWRPDIVAVSVSCCMSPCPDRRARRSLCCTALLR